MRIRVRQTWKDQISNPEKVSEILRSILSTESEIDRDKEHIWVLGLSTSNVIRYIDLVSLGTLDMTLCDPREVFRLAVMKGVKAIIVAHNHPLCRCRNKGCYAVCEFMPRARGIDQSPAEPSVVDAA